MLQLFRVWSELCLLRRTPQDIPASGILLGISLCCYALVSVLVSLPGYGVGRALLLALTDLTLLFAFVCSLLLMQARAARINQTLSAMAGSGSVLGLVALPLLLATGAGASAETVPVSLAVLWLLLLLWNILVVAHIIRHALSSSWLVGFGLSLMYALISMQIIGSLFS